MPIIEQRIPIYARLPAVLFDGAFQLWLAPGGDNEVGRAHGYYFYDHTWHATPDHILGWSREIVHCLDRPGLRVFDRPITMLKWLCGHGFQLVNDRFPYMRVGPIAKKYPVKDIVAMAHEAIQLLSQADVTLDQWGANEHNQWLSGIQRHIQLNGHWAVQVHAEGHGYLDAFVRDQNHRNAIWHPRYPSGPQNSSGVGQTYMNTILNAGFQAGTFTGAATIYNALHSANPSDTSDGTEAAYTGYARQAITCNSTNFPNASAGAIVYGLAITFPTNTGSSETEVATSWQAASSGGTQPNWWGTFSSVAVGTGIAPQFNASALTTSGV